MQPLWYFNSEILFLISEFLKRLFNTVGVPGQKPKEF